MHEQEKKNSCLKDAASTAHMISGAVKTGKAIAGAAKGAAAGPYGAAAAAAWESRHHIGKIVLVIAAAGPVYSHAANFDFWHSVQ